MRYDDPELMQAFLEETLGYVPQIQTSLEAFARTRDASNLTDAYRLMHTIKGASAMLGFSEISRAAREAEDRLESLIQGEAAFDEAKLLEIYDGFETVNAQLLRLAHNETSFDVGAFETSVALNQEHALTLDETAIESVQMDANFEIQPPAGVFETSNGDDALEAVDAEMLEVFSEEADEHLRVMSASLSRLETTAADVEALLDLRRSTHTLKGAAGVVGLKTVAALLHKMEDLLDRLCDEQQAIEPAIASAMIRAVDVIENLTRGATPAAYRTQVAELSHAFGAALVRLPSPTTQLNDASFAEASTYNEYQSFTNQAALDKALPDKSVSLLETVTLQFGAEGESNAQRIEAVELTTPDTDDAASLAPAKEANGQSENNESVARRVVRVPLERLDALVKLVGELVISRTTFEGRLLGLHHEVAELQHSTERLRRVSHKLETEYETSSLRSGAERFAAHGRKASEASDTQARSDAHATDFFKPSPLTHEWLSSGFIEPDFRDENSSISDFDELEFDRYTEFHRLSREIAETTSDAGAVKNELSNLAGDFDALLTRQRRLTSEIHERLMRVRMVSIGTIASRLQRTVRVAADAEGKTIEFAIEGAHVELDTTVIDRMADPLLHILRNSVSHGIERADVRGAIGKPAHGRIVLRAAYEGTQVVLEITDDGAGIDAAAVRARAVENNFITHEQAAQMNDKQALALVFLPGLSTAKKISEISGRGIGMDVVKDRVERLQGMIDLDSTPGKGTRLTIRLPLTLVATRALIVRAINETYAVPLTAVHQITRASRAQLEAMQATGEFAFNAESHRAIYLSRWLQLGEDFPVSEERAPVLIIKTAGRTAALVVDEIIEGRDIVIKSLGAYLKGAHGLMGATVRGDGRVVPILNPDDIVRGDNFISVSTPAEQLALRTRRSVAVERETRGLRIMIVDDSPSVRRVMANALRHAEMTPTQAKDGIDALEMLHGSANTEMPDVILLDVEMPRMDGYELLATLRQQTLTRDIPVIMITSRTGEKHRRKALTLGASEYLTKPYLEEELFAHIKRLTKID